MLSPGLCERHSTGCMSAVYCKQMGMGEGIGSSACDKRERRITIGCMLDPLKREGGEETRREKRERDRQQCPAAPTKTKKEKGRSQCMHVQLRRPNRTATCMIVQIN